MKKVYFVIFLLMFSISMFATDWRMYVSKYMGMFEDRNKIIEFLEKNMKEIPKTEKRSAIIILAYSYSRMKNKIMESKWMSKFFEDQDSRDPRFLFLKRKDRIKIKNYVNRWKNNFPEIKIKLKENKFYYYKFPETVTLLIRTNIPVKIKVGEVEDYISKGENNIELNGSILSKEKQESNFTIEYTSNEITLKKILNLKKSYIVPENSMFNPLTGVIKIKNREPKIVEKTKKELVTKKYFDKKHFIKKSLPFLGIGLFTLSLNEFVFKSSLETSKSISNKNSMYSFRSTSGIFGVGITLKGILEFAKSFKKETSVQISTTIDKKAQQYNQFLERSIKNAMGNTFVVIELEEEVKK